MLPQYGNEDKDGGNEDESEGDLRHWARRKWFDFAVGAVIIALFVPTRKRGEKEEANECKNNSDDSRNGRQQAYAERTIANGNSHQIRKHDIVLESICHPYQVERILVNGHLRCQTRRIVTAQKGSTVGINTYTKIADTNFELRLSDNVGNRRGNTGVNLGGIEARRIGLVIEGYEEYAGN